MCEPGAPPVRSALTRSLKLASFASSRKKCVRSPPSYLCTFFGRLLDGADESPPVRGSPSGGRRGSSSAGRRPGGRVDGLLVETSGGDPRPPSPPAPPAPPPPPPPPALALGYDMVHAGQADALDGAPPGARPSQRTMCPRIALELAPLTAVAFAPALHGPSAFFKAAAAFFPHGSPFRGLHGVLLLEVR